MIIFVISPKKIYVVGTQSPRRGNSNEYSQHMYVFRENYRKLSFNYHQISF